MIDRAWIRRSRQPRHAMRRQVLTRRGMARQARPDSRWLAALAPAVARQDWPWRREPWCGWAGMASLGTPRCGTVGQGSNAMASCVLAKPGQARQQWLGEAGQPGHRQDQPRRGSARPAKKSGMASQGGASTATERAGMQRQAWLATAPPVVARRGSARQAWRASVGLARVRPVQPWGGSAAAASQVTVGSARQWHAGLRTVQKEVAPGCGGTHRGPVQQSDKRKVTPEDG